MLETLYKTPAAGLQWFCLKAILKLVIKGTDLILS